MRKKVIAIILSTLVILSASYLFALEVYDTMPNKLEKFQEKLLLEGITYDEIGVQLTGIQYDMPQTIDTLTKMNEEMNVALAHEEGCSKLCQISHAHLANTNMTQGNQFIEIDSNENNETWEYAFSLRNQKDIHDNMFYSLNMTGRDIQKLDTLRARGREQLEDWNVEISESIYFKGMIEGPVSKDEEWQIASGFFNQFDGESTNYYEDDLMASTCVYYAYTPWVKEYVKENGNERTNMQVGFKYNDILNQTEIIIAFPFYNMPF